ncbi:MAG: SDR family NAD(P)-dependent oxidoreductase [Clostridia bacterium]|nr:SDR family NAD(P)-dependent oxidoreductase [Clostridia bacterium]
MKKMDELLCRLLLCQLQAIGLFRDSEGALAELKRKSGLCSRYDRWMEESIEVLVRNNYVVQTGEVYSSVVTHLNIDKVWAEWEAEKRSWLKEPGMEAKAALSESMLRALPEILRGKRLATDVMFPDSSMRLVEGIYRNSPVADYFNDVLADTLTDFIKKRIKQEAAAQVRILEIGAGTGGNSAVVFRKLEPYRKNIGEYCYTDISKAFLMHAEKEFGTEYNYLTYKIFNAEVPIAVQDIDAGGYDVVIAANVLHATKNIRQTLRNAKAVLKKGGILLLNEISANTIFTHLTFGLLDGWWLYEDTGLRIPGCPGLYPGTWKEVLQNEGFHTVLFPARQSHNLGQQIIAAQSDGVVRQKLQYGKTGKYDDKINGSLGYQKEKGGVLQVSAEKRHDLIKTEEKTLHSEIAVTDQMAEDYIKETITEKLSHWLKVNTGLVDVDQSFSDYGVDSITGVNLVQAINQILKIDLETTCIFNYSSVNKLTLHILSRYRDVIVNALRQNTKQYERTSRHSGESRDIQTSSEHFRGLQKINVLKEADIKEKVGMGNVSIKKESIAIIGMSGRFAKSKTVDELWNHLANGMDLIEEISRWDIGALYPEGAEYCRHGSFLEDIDRFDPLFFNISGLEATYMDPQQRFFLEESWKALEDAGYAGADIDGHSCGVYVGCGGVDYQELLGDNPPPQSFWGNSGSVIPARIAYYLNLKGPAVCIDTACSSSLVAIHLACQGLWTGETDMALAGGVFIQSTPGFYLCSNRAGMLSLTGRCHTFDERADGFVPGEGVGVIVLKRLKEAVADGDHIYGVIRGSGINQDGTTNGITAPSAISQESLECHVYDEFEINPQDIQMVEAHGTGTKLGDPIEFSALTKAFRRYTDKREYCAIGSVKTNLGHAATAAGVAGVIKILLSLKHRQIPPSLHFKTGNSNIRFKESPFYVNTELKEWEVTHDIKRCAVVSSFGFSGTNAHLAIEEAPEVEFKHAEKPGYLIVLSARTLEQLRQQARQLIAFYERNQEADCGNMSYTLLLGRRHFNHRLACVVRSTKELGELLNKWLEKGKASRVYLSQLHENDNSEQHLLKEYGNQCIQNCKNGYHENQYLEHISVVAELYVQGYSLEYKELFSDGGYSKISLPTYPFAMERYWVPDNPNSRTNTKVAAFIHPLLHQNISDFFRQRFSSTFTGKESYLPVNTENGRQVLSGLAYLEMVRVAVVQAAGGMEHENNAIHLRDVVWIHPAVIAGENLKIHVELHSEDDGDVTYEIYSDSPETGAEPVVYNRGSVVLDKGSQVYALNLEAIRHQCNQFEFSSFRSGEDKHAAGDKDTCIYKEIERLYCGLDKVLMKLALPLSTPETGNKFTVQPALMDIILRAAVQFMTGLDVGKPLIPLNMHKLDILSNCIPTEWAYIRYSEGAKNQNSTYKVDIDLCDGQGNICLRIKGFEITGSAEAGTDTFMNISRQVAENADADQIHQMMTFEEVWVEQALESVSPPMIKTVVCFLSNSHYQQVIAETMKSLNPETKIVFISEGSTYRKYSKEVYSVSNTDQNTYTEALSSIRVDYGEIDAVLYLWALEDLRHIYDFTGIVYIIKAIAVSGLKPDRLMLAAQAQNGLDRCYLESLIGFERSLGLVLPGIQMAVILEEAYGQVLKPDMKEWMKRVWAELNASKAQSVLYKDKMRNVCRIRPTVIEQGISLIKPGGTYLITGGCGGLGFLFAEHFAKTQPVNLILTGRSPIDEEKGARIKTLESFGSKILYIQADVCDADGMKEGLNQATKLFGEIHGIIHAAGIQGKDSILEKDIESFNKILKPKIQGTLVLDEILEEASLEFICYFSSSSAIMGDFGSCDYAVANRFQMAYAHYRNRQEYPEKHNGKAVVINWPLWRDGGMGLGNSENAKIYLNSSGQSFLEANEGMAVFERILSQNIEQQLVIVGQPGRVKSFLGLTEYKKTAPAKVSVFSGTGRRLEMRGLSPEQCIEWDLKELTSKLLRISREKLDNAANLADFGFDSLALTEFAALLTSHFGIEITPALFYGYSTFEKLVQYFWEKHRDAIREFYNEKIEEKAVSPAVKAGTAIQQEMPVLKKNRFIAGSTSKSNQEPIAIIGMSGRFPQARNIDELWKIFEEGREVVQEIPAERFDWRQYFGDPMKDQGKTNCKWCGCVPGVKEFDPLFFEISPREAEYMDPRHRLLLQEAWNALEDAGYGVHKAGTNKTGMFVGVEDGDYHLIAGDKSSITSNHNAVLSARLSYFLNLNGPCLAVNTACSSGLTAVHEACLSLRNYECDTAVAAGVNLLLTPQIYVKMGQAGMLSPDGKCFAFDKRANGMVPGEAVAVVVLKRLSQARADGDPIYAVIQGSGINYDGKTNGITAPNGVAQANLLKTVYDQYRINPEDIGYIVTHGTGTKLGDPVEINALYDAYKSYTDKQGYCALTSTKTNLGHTLAASGVVSLISLVQALRHGKIPASLHCQEENDYINWEKSPFYVNKTTKEWVKDGGKPLTGAVSAFGMSGTNVHMVVRSYSEEDGLEPSAVPPCFLLVLSAKTPEALQERIKDMINMLKNRDVQQQDLHRICYTLMEGRQHFSCRCAVVIRGKEEAVYALSHAGDSEKLFNVFVGKVSGSFKAQKAMKQYVIDTAEQTRLLLGDESKYQEALHVLADLYCQGHEIPWDLLYSGIKLRRTHLPTYPFAREQYWVPEDEAYKAVISTVLPDEIQYIHPLLQRNTSSLLEQRFSSTFTGAEFFMKDHLVNGVKVLPGVACLEMARAALEQSMEAMVEAQSGIRLKNVVWLRPVAVVDQPVKVNIALYPEEDGEIAYEIYSQYEEGAEPVEHSKGIAVFRKPGEDLVIDIASLKAKCSKGILTSEECYDAFRAIGLNYGPGYQGIEKVYIGEGLAITKLSLKTQTFNAGGRFVLHPGLMDSALQASIGLLAGDGDMIFSGSFAMNKPIVPFALQEITVFDECCPDMWALIRYGSSGQTGDKLKVVDIDLCDEQGKICVQFRGLSLITLNEGLSLKEAPVNSTTLLLEPCWREDTSVEEATGCEYARHLVMLCEQPDILRQDIEAFMGDVSCIPLQSECGNVAVRFEAYAVQVFEEIQSILRKKPAGNVLIQVVAPAHGEVELFSGISAMLKTTHLENPNISCQLIEAAIEEGPERIVEKLIENSRRPFDGHIRYRDGKRWVAGFKEVEPAKDMVYMPWKDNGTYLVTGGAGGLGTIFASEIAQKVKCASIILVGRSELDGEKQKKLSKIEALGAKAEYRCIDVADRKSVENLIQDICKEHGGINGVIHSAGVIRDNFIIKKTGDELKEVMAPKVSGLVNLDEASRELPLDFFVSFSSISGRMGNPGQSDYSAANAFLDSYSAYRNLLVTKKERHGITLSISWPLWKDGGMQIEAETERMLTENTGITAIRTSEAIRAFYQAFACGKEQVLVLSGDEKRLKKAFLERQTPNKAVEILFQDKMTVPVIEDGLLREKSEKYFKELLSEVINLPAERIEADAPMEKYGIDSIMVMKLTNQLEKIFGSLPKTLFFEYQNIRDIAGYFMSSYRQQLSGLLGIEQKAEAIMREAVEATAVTGPEKPAAESYRRLRFSPVRRKSEAKNDESTPDIAIIGISGRYPGAKNLREFWKNLRDGKDCITEIPKDRWDYRLYFAENKNEPGKTYSKWGGFLEGVEQFDPLFFNISPREAELMDPQERLFLECVYETLEDAGYTRETLSMNQDMGLEGNVGVYVGVMYEEYQLYGAQETLRGRPVALYGSPASIANRISYFFNFHGPSMAVDTMCSSSLTAIHLACQSLQRGACELAIAGGVNISVHPNKYLLLAQGKFASSNGRCESFGQGGDGYVPGEGVGAVLLKPLYKAVSDGDSIYGVIKGTAINHGGKTNGYTVPNPNAQAGVIERAVKEAGVNPRVISYIEAHGTGTSLGDPIEIAGLAKAFGSYTRDKGFCAIGSAKSNIGHCESAAGIAGLTKVLLQMKYRQLVPSLHSKVLNPKIDFAGTPFIVQQVLSEWKRPIVEISGERREYPRIAGISSFGAGGSNAHVIVEEYTTESEAKTQIMITSHKPAIVVLSAKSEERLKEQVKRLLTALSEQQLTDYSLADMAYTLQIGREAMEERLAVIIVSIKELEEKLNDYLDGRENIRELYRGQSKRNKETIGLLASDEDMEQIIEIWIRKGKFSKIAEFWVKGLNFDWNKLYGSLKPCRISLPAYPFEKERYWVPNAGEESDCSPLANPVNTALLHPLLHSNTSDFSGLKFTSVFTGQEFFLSDHTVNGQKILPAVAYLEMAREAVERVMGDSYGKQAGMRLENIVWTRPVAVGKEPVQVDLRIDLNENGRISFQISSFQGRNEAETVVCSEGRALPSLLPKHPLLDIESLKAQCSLGYLSPAQCYETFNSIGIEYGPGHRGIQEVYLGTGQAIARLALPSCAADAADKYVLHPSLMDSALQASIGLIGKNSDEQLLPFSMEILEVHGKCTPGMWSSIRYSDGYGDGGRLEKLDIDMCDEAGNICVRMKGVSFRTLEGGLQRKTETKVGLAGNVEERGNASILLTPVWDSVPIEKGQMSPLTTDKIALIGGNTENRKIILQYYKNACVVDIQFKDTVEGIAEKLREQGPFNHILWVAPDSSIKSVVEDTVIDEQNRGVLQLYNVIKALLTLDYGTRDLGWSIITIRTQPINERDKADPTHAGIFGLIGSMAKEYPNWKTRLVDLESAGEWPPDIFTLPQDMKGGLLVYRNKNWHQQRLLPFSPAQMKQNHFKCGGVYVVIGGAGGVGEAWSEYMIRTYKAQIIWIGRREKDTDIRAKLDRLAGLGPTPSYITADATDINSLQQAYEEIKRKHSLVNGVVHSAIVLSDQSLAKMEAKQFRAVLSSKIDVSVNLARVFHEEPLDFVLFFSSFNSFAKAAGQSNYAAGCTFKDAFANRLSMEWPCAVKTINWGYWGSVGIVASEDYQERMAQAGIGSIEPPEAMEALENLMSGPINQVALVKTTGHFVME